MSFAESTIFFGLHAIRMCLFILRHVVVPLFTFCTCQCNLCAHDFHLHLIFRCFSASLLCQISLLANFEHKKKTYIFHSPEYHTIRISARQVFPLRTRSFHGFFYKKDISYHTQASPTGADKNILWHILPPGAAACGNPHLRAVV